MATTVKAETVGSFTYKQLEPLALGLLKQGYCVLVTGGPGVGKSTMGASIAKKVGFSDDRYVDLRPSQMDSVELCGMQVPNRETRTIEHYAPYWVFKDEPFFLTIDEINAATPKLTQAVLYQILQDRRVGPHKFAPGTMMMGFGNTLDDNALAVELSSALNNRCAHFILLPDIEGWLEWALKNGVAPEYAAFIGFKGLKALYDNNGSPAFPSPRSNAAAGKSIRSENFEGMSESQKIHMMREYVAAFCGQAQAMEFMKYRNVYSRVNIMQILEQGAIPNIKGGGDASEMSFLYALIYSCSEYLTNRKPEELKGAVIDNTIKLLQELGGQPQYQVLFCKLLTSKNLDVFQLIQKHPEATKVIPIFIKLLFDAGKLSGKKAA